MTHKLFLLAKTVGTVMVHLTLLHSERPKLYAILAFLSAKGLITPNLCTVLFCFFADGSQPVNPQIQDMLVNSRSQSCYLVYTITKLKDQPLSLWMI